MPSTIDKQITAITQARDILNGGKAPRRNEAALLMPLLTEAALTLARVAASEDAVKRQERR